MNKHLCKCVCHQPGVTIMHFMQCCDTCPRCKQGIQFGNMREHMEDCNPEIKGTYRVYLFADALGNTAYAVAEESCNSIQVCGLRDPKGNPIYFESESHHAPVWCEKNGVQYRVVDREFTLTLKDS